MLLLTWVVLRFAHVDPWAMTVAASQWVLWPVQYGQRMLLFCLLFPVRVEQYYIIHNATLKWDLGNIISIPVVISLVRLCTLSFQLLCCAVQLFLRSITAGTDSFDSFFFWCDFCWKQTVLLMPPHAWPDRSGPVLHLETDQSSNLS